MAQGDSIVSIMNIALIELGEDLIVAPTQNTKRAIIMNARYDDVRRATLRSHPWDCARQYVQLAASPTPPPFKYNQSYPLPNDFLRMVDLPDNDMAQWDVVGNNLYTDESAPLNVIYIFDLQDPTRFDPLLVHAIANHLALECAWPITHSQETYDRVAKKFDGKLEAARLVTSQENSPKEWDEDIWLRSRR